MRERFKVGLVLVGLAMIQQDMMDPRTKEDADGDGDGNGNIEKEVEIVSKGIASILLPMIDSLGGLSLEEERAAAPDYSAEAL